MLSDLLKLDASSANIKKIDIFISKALKQSSDYEIALAYKCLLMHKIGKTSDALKILYQEQLKFKELEDESIIAICDSIIAICLDKNVKRYDQVLKYIEYKKNYLPISKNIIYIKDKINYYLAINDLINAKDELLNYLNDDLTKEELHFANEALSDIYYNLKEYDKYLSLVDNLYEYYQTNLAYDKISLVGIRKLEIASLKEEYLKVIKEAKAYLLEENSNDYKIKAAAFLIKAYINTSDYKRASIIESEYEEYLDSVDNQIALEFSRQALDLYTKTNTLISINAYQNKIKELESIKKEVKKQRKKQIEIIEDIPIPVYYEENENPSNIHITLNKENKDKNTEYIINTVSKEVNNLVVSKNYDQLKNIFEAICNTNINVKFREIFRLTCIEIEKRYNIENIAILYFKKNYHVIQYKKQRAYDKDLEFSNIVNTLAFNAYDKGQISFYQEDTNIDIYTNKEYENNKYGIAIPLKNEDEVIGAISYISDNSFIDKEMVYESLLLLSNLLCVRLTFSLYANNVINENKKLYFINENMKQGMKEQSSDFIHLSKYATTMLNIYEDITYDEYLNRIKDNYKVEYKKIIDKLYNLLPLDLSITYEFKKDNDYIYLKEIFYPINNDDNIVIVSILEDITKEKNKDDTLISLAYKDPISKLDKQLKLTIDIANIYDNKKLSIACFEVVNYKLYEKLYGYNFANQLIFTIGKYLIEAISEYFDTKCYHLDNFRYVLLFDNVNDKRIIDSRLNKIFNEISNKIFKLNSRVKLYFNCGVYRLNKNSSDDKDSILFYAMDAIDEYAYSSINTINHFDINIHKKKFIENHLVTHISEAIDHGQISISYKQIVDIKNSSVYGYFANFNLESYEIEEDKLKKVVDLRNLNDMIDKYIISNTFKEIKLLKDQKSKAFLCFIKIDKNTSDDKLLSFISSIKNYYKIDSKYIVFCFDSARDKNAKLLKQLGFMIASFDILDIYNQNIDYYLFDFKSVLEDSIIKVINQVKEYNIIPICINVDTKEDITMLNGKVDYIYGKYYKKNLKIKTIIDKLN